MTHPRLFGTDGVRGTFGQPPLDESTVRRLGAALAQSLRRRFDLPRVVLGGDTRDSTPTLARWLAAELEAQDVEAIWLGVVPTPAVAFATRRLEAHCGIAVSASHNPHPDNGIKLIGRKGFKLSQQAETRIEAGMTQADLPPIGSTLADLKLNRDAVDAWIEHLVSSLDGRRLDGLSVVLDAGHGAASALAAPLFERLGARVVALHTAPDGTNINRESGSTHPYAMAEAVRREGADLGFAFDGDADRVILADDDGTVRDGDAILYLWARDRMQRGDLPGRAIVATSMSNLGLEKALEREGIGLVRCDVGDRVVVKTLQKRSLVLGGEQSGHIVDLDRTTTGDGLLTALHLADLRLRSGQRVTEQLADFRRYPQLLRNVRVTQKPPMETIPRIARVARAVEQALAGDGRLVLRYSGTEPLARVMIEGPDQDHIEALAGDLVTAIREEIGE